MTRRGSRRLALIAIAGSSSSRLVATLLAVGESRDRRSIVLGDGARVTYADDATLLFVDAAGDRRQDECAARARQRTKTRARTILRHGVMGRLRVLDRLTGRLSHRRHDFAGFERWS